MGRRGKAGLEGAPLDPTIKVIPRAQPEVRRIERFFRLIGEAQRRPLCGAPDAAHEIGHVVDPEIRPVIPVAQHLAPIARVSADPGRERVRHAAMGDELPGVPEPPLVIEHDRALAAAPVGGWAIEKIGMIDG